MEFTIEKYFNVSPEIIFEAWLTSDGHTQMTGGEANCNDVIGKQFSAWDGYITGENLEIIPFTKIVQSWRTMDFNEHEDHSIIEIYLTPNEEGCNLKLIHKNIPEGQPNYEQGWEEHYFEPMSVFFEN